MTLREEIRSKLDKDGIDYILAQYVDIHGVPKVKGVPAPHFDDLVDDGAGFAGAAVHGFGQGPHDPDMMAIPDLSTYTPIPWAQGVARFACDIYVERKVWPYCSRHTLQRVVDEARQMGFEFMVGVEPEFFLVKQRPDGTLVPADEDDDLKKPCYDYKALSKSMGFLREMIQYMNQLGWDVYQSDHEDANGQFEINFSHADAVTSADRYIFFKMMSHEVARKHGFIVTHMAKPFANRTGSGLHFHFSLVDRENGENVFTDPKDARGLGQSRLAYQFLAGVMRHMGGMTAVLSPTVNCYKRLIITGSRSGYTWTPAFVSYGGNNRTQMFRTPGPGRFECRAVSAACNPYLAMAVFLKAGLAGLREELDPGEPIHGNMYQQDARELMQNGIALVPQNLFQALELMEADELVRAALGESLAKEFVKVKRDEWDDYHRSVSPWELQQYLRLF